MPDAPAAPSVIELLDGIKFVPVVVIDDPARAPDVAAALAEGGITCAEMTLRTEGGLAAIAGVAGTAGFTVGAGTVLTPDQVDRCIDAGAQFIVSPGLDVEVVERALERGVAVLPGVATASEIQQALRAGLQAVKFFPADRLGGLDTIQSLAGPFPQVRFLPSGGVSMHNAREYLSHPAIFAVGGSWMASRKAIAAGDLDEIRRLSAEATALVSDL